MARKPRSQVLYDGCCAHVFSRAIEKRWIFLEPEDFKEFIRLLQAMRGMGGYRLYHYCVMITHFHLVLGLEKLGDFSKALQQIKWQYTHYFNVKYKRYGPLWRERFKSMLIEDERYLAVCGQYVEYNPVKANLALRSEDWPYSSSRFYFSGEEDPLLCRYDGPQEFPKEPVDIKNDAFFTKGDGIGSALFKFCLRKGIRRP